MATQNLIPTTYRFRLLTVTLACIFFGVLLNTNLNESHKREMSGTVRDASESASFRWHPDLYRILSFGHIPSAVDWLLIRFMVDTNLSKIKTGEETEIYRVLNLATELDPAYFTLYVSGANFLVVVRDDKEGALKLISKGRTFMREKLPDYSRSFRDSYWPDGWRIPFTLGYMYLMEFQNAAKAAEAYGEMKDYETTPGVLRTMAQNSRTVEGQFNLAINSIGMLKQWHEDDERYREELDAKKELLLASRDLILWNRALKAKFPKAKPSAAEWERFRIAQGIPARDRLGGEVYLDSKGRIDSKTQKIPVLGIDLESAISE